MTPRDDREQDFGLELRSLHAGLREVLCERRANPRRPFGARLHYVDEGTGDVVLFVHGTPTWSFEWRHAIRHLSRTHRCIALDHLGFGLSDRPRDFDYTPESHAGVFRAFIDHLGLHNVTLVVHDYGGPIALPLALDAPGRVRRLAIVNSWMWSFQDDPGMKRKGRIAGGRFGRFLYRRANFSLRVLTPSAYADRRKLTPAIHAQYLAPFPDRRRASSSFRSVTGRTRRRLMRSRTRYDNSSEDARPLAPRRPLGAPAPGSPIRLPRHYWTPDPWQRHVGRHH